MKMVNDFEISNKKHSYLTTEEAEGYCNRKWAEELMKEDERVKEVVFERNKAPLIILYKPKERTI